MSTPRLDKQIILKKKEDRRIVAGHPWVFSNEIEKIQGDPAIGDIVELHASGGLLLGIGLYNPHSLIAFRLLSKTVETIDYRFFEQRIKQALELRRSLYPGNETFRLIHGEADMLPGLVVDKYNDILCVQTFAYGMDARLTTICDILESLLHPRGIVERNESPLRTLEGLSTKKGMLHGSAPATHIIEHGINYLIDPLEGQKTGFFLDQRENRLSVRAFAKGAHVLDCFCNDGGFALNAAFAGAVSVAGIDISEDALNRARRNAALNNLRNVQFERHDVFDKLDACRTHGEQFDVIILDPPSFTKNRKSVPAARKGYKDLHMKALAVLKPGGILITSSCSHHITPEVFASIIDEAGRKSGRTLQLLDWRGASPDHPTLLNVPETHYLKFGILRCI